MRKVLKEVYNNYKNSDVFIVGGGPSFKKEYGDFLKDKTTMALNSSVKYVPNVDMVYWTDDIWACDNMELLKTIDAYKFHGSTQCDYYITNDKLGPHGEIKVKLLNGMGYSENIDEIYGNNSGAQAINLLANLNVKNIYLLGFDMNIQKGKTHFHDDYNLPIKPSIYSDLFIPSIEAIKPLINKKGINVINCSIQSSLNCFNKIPFEQIMENYNV